MEIATIGGYNEVGKNMTAIKVGNEVVILDMGLFLPAVIGYEEEQEYLTSDELIRIGAIPDDNVIKEWKNKVKAIVLSHCHLDHIGATPYLCNKYKSPIIGTDFTIEVLKKVIRDKGLKIKNELRKLNVNNKIKISKNLTIELINVTHSTPQSTIVVLHTKEGKVVYANDFKFDNYPTLGKKPNYKELKDLKDVRALIVNSLYSNSGSKTPSEKIAKELLKDILLATNNKDSGIIITTFSSNLARLKGIIELGKRLNRKIVFLGRSIGKYVDAGERAKIINFSKQVEIVTYANKISKKLKNIEKEGKEKYIIVCTGSQGEPKAVLSKMVNGLYDFKFLENDHVIFSCRTIPTETNIMNREIVENKLKEAGVRIFKKIHASGHGGTEDIRDLITMVEPKHIIPIHGDHERLKGTVDLAIELKYDFGNNIHLSNDGKILEI